MGLMASVGEDKAVRRQRRPSVTGVRGVARERVLVVDDDPAILMLTRAKLEDGGFEVFTSPDPLEASLLVQRIRPTILVLDVRMPGLAGDRLAQALARAGHGRTLSVILHSGIDDSDLDQAVERAGALGAIRKSGDPRYFMFQLRRLLAQRPALPR